MARMRRSELCSRCPARSHLASRSGGRAAFLLMEAAAECRHPASLAAALTGAASLRPWQLP
eukprot:3770240-Prymnesium_polylepis.1